jgi:hypothetical protein
MARLLLTENAVSISENRQNRMSTLASEVDMPLSVHNRNDSAYYCVLARACEA